MIYKMYFTVNGHDDSIILEAETMEEIRTKAQQELDRRNAEYTGDERLDR